VAVTERLQERLLLVLIRSFEAESLRLNDVPEAWREAIAAKCRTPVAALLEQMKSLRVASLAFLATVLDPEHDDTGMVGMEPWLRLVNEGAGLLREERRAEAASFLLAVGLASRGTEAAPLVVVCFEAVHEAAASGELCYRSWRHLKESLPRIELGWEWDKCERLRRGLVAHFARNRWLPDQFLQCFTRREVFRRTINSCRQNEDAERFAIELSSAVQDGRIAARDWQQDVLSKAVYRTWRGETKLRWV
jgi:hypothetical protein